MENFYKTVLLAWADIFPLDPIFAVFYLISRLCIYLTVIYVPLLVIFFSRALSFQFKKLIQNAANIQDLSEAHFADLRNKDKLFWMDLVEKHQTLCKLTKSINSFLSPLIFAWMAFSVYGLSLQLFRVMSATQRFDVPIYLFAIVFGMESLFFLVTIISAAKVNTNAVRILNILRNCPRELYYETEVARLEHQVSAGQTIGLTGMGCFAITRRFFLTVFNAIFTLEIVLLQSSQSPQSNAAVAAVAATRKT